MFALNPVSDIISTTGRSSKVTGKLLVFFIFISIIDPSGPVSIETSNPRSLISVSLTSIVSFFVYPTPPLRTYKSFRCGITFSTFEIYS